MSDLPRPVADLCAALGASPGIEAVTIGGSRAASTADDASDWDVGLYYRGPADLATLARYGEVHPPGSWGRIMNGGAWLTLEGLNRVAELAVNRVVVGTLPVVGEYPRALAENGERRWHAHADFSLTHARMRAERSDVTGAVAQAAKAVLETAHALACRRRQWVLNEKKLVEQVGLDGLHEWFVRVPRPAAPLVGWVSEVRAALARSG